uniref:Phosphatidylinositol 3-kinase catalytic subunit type 3 n=1 Tax=Macrostomum lignano TaxID=282301 RepID=A0A1I8GZ38_9PLAT
MDLEYYYQYQQQQQQQDTVLHVLYSHELDKCNLKLKIGCLEGCQPNGLAATPESALEDALLNFHGDSPYVTLELHSEGRRLTLPRQTQRAVVGKLAGDRRGPYSWNEWLAMRRGMYELVVWPGQVAEPGVTPGKVGKTSYPELSRLLKVRKRYSEGSINKIDWQDQLALKDLEVRIVAEKRRRGGLMFLNVTFQKFLLDSLEHSVVYFERDAHRLLPQTGPADLVVCPDPDINAANLSEEKHHAIERGVSRGAFDRERKPNAVERDCLHAIMAYPPHREISMEERDLVWKYRYYLSRYKRALGKFLRCIDFTRPAEVQQALGLIRHWQALDSAEALELLSPDFPHPAVRHYAVSRLAKSPMDELHLLTEALAEDEGPISYRRHAGAASDEPLTNFLIDHCCKRQGGRLAQLFYWYLTVEAEDAGEGEKFFGQVRNRLLQRLKNGNLDQRSLALDLKRQDRFVARLATILSAVNSERGDRLKKEELLRQQQQQQQQKSPPRSSKTYTTIFKYGDDLRQDQLVMQMIELMDRLLRQENVDLRLTPYRVLATGREQGFVQCINSVPLSSVQTSVLNYLRQCGSSPASPYGVKPEVLENYVRSCAGYCIVTYLLGVGDRHLDNLMLTRDGRLFHIDFGFILGRDPKVMPPPMKLTDGMVAAMGGQDSQEFIAFLKHCDTAYKSLRRHASVIVNLFSLMLDSSVPEIAMEPDKTLKKLTDRFCLHLTDEEATQHIVKVIQDSLSAFMPQLIDTLHDWTQAMKR